MCASKILYSWLLNNTGLNCAHPLICGFFNSKYYGTVGLIPEPAEGQFWSYTQSFDCMEGQLPNCWVVQESTGTLLLAGAKIRMARIAHCISIPLLRTRWSRRRKEQAILDSGCEWIVWVDNRKCVICQRLDPGCGLNLVIRSSDWCSTI